jgi:hypothetical protein
MRAAVVVAAFDFDGIVATRRDTLLPFCKWVWGRAFVVMGKLPVPLAYRACCICCPITSRSGACFTCARRPLNGELEGWTTRWPDDVRLTAA